MRTVRRTAAALASAAAVLTGCAGAPTDPGETTDGAPDDVELEDPGTAQPGDAEVAGPGDEPARNDDQPTSTGPTHELLAFTGRQLDGGTFDGSQLRGDVLVWFWAPW